MIRWRTTDRSTRKKEPLYPSGYRAELHQVRLLEPLDVASEAQVGDDITVTVEVTNTGEVAGDEVVQLYVRALDASVAVPHHSLQGFARVHLEPGQSTLVSSP